MLSFFDQIGLIGSSTRETLRSEKTFSFIPRRSNIFHFNSFFRTNPGDFEEFAERRDERPEVG
jgi:hypothetical protein